MGRSAAFRRRVTLSSSVTHARSLHTSPLDSPENVKMEYLIPEEIARGGRQGKRKCEIARTDPKETPKTDHKSLLAEILT
jgi:hypothetical protein